MGIGICFVEYRGYGPFSQGKADAFEMLADVEKAVSYISMWKANEKNPNRIISYGRSIGSLMAIQSTLFDKSIVALILESGFSMEGWIVWTKKILAMRGETSPQKMNEFEKHSRTRLNLDEKLRKFEKPVLIIHAQDDPVVSILNAESNIKVS